MNIWLVKLEEPVPQDADYRPYRMGMLESELVACGHDVVRWCSDLNHLSGRHRYGVTCTVRYSDRQRYEFINSGIKYKSPISLGRILDNFLIKFKIRNRAKLLDAPDLIVCSMPTPALCRLSAELAERYVVPLVLDCRDYWPEIISAEARGWKRLAAKMLVLKMRQDLAFACKRAHSFVGITGFFTQHLLTYSERHATSLDVVFPLGFDPSAVVCSDSSHKTAMDFWYSKGVDLDQKLKIVYFAGRLNRTVFDAIKPVVDAAKVLSRSSYNILFVFCGSGAYEAAIKEEFVGCVNVVFPGEVDPSTLKVLRDHSAAALQPIDRRIDYQNSYSNKFFEYLSSGLPVFSWLDGVSGQKLIEENCGYIYYSSEDLIAKMSDFFACERRQLDMSARAKALFLREFDAKNVYASYAHHLEVVLDDYKVRHPALVKKVRS